MVQVDCTHLGVASLQVSASLHQQALLSDIFKSSLPRASYERKIQGSVADHVEDAQHASLSTKVNQGVEQSLVFWNLQIYSLFHRIPC